MEAAEAGVSSSVPVPPPPRPPFPTVAAEEQNRFERRALESVLQNCRRALQLLENPDLGTNPLAEAEPPDAEELLEPPLAEERLPPQPQPAADTDADADELCALLKSKVESPDFLEKLGNIQASIYHNTNDDNASWNLISATDVWDTENFDVEDDSDQDGYVIIRQEDIVDSIACFMAAYLLTLKQTKELTPNQLQDALCKTFSVTKKKSRLRKAWDGSKVIYNVASWGATAIGIYKNPAIFEAASVAFCSSCQVISKLL